MLSEDKKWVSSILKSPWIVKKIKIVHYNLNKEQRKQPNCFILFCHDLTAHFQINAKAASKIWQMLSEDKKEQRKQPNCFILFRRDLTAHFQIRFNSKKLLAGSVIKAI
ncbi:unnamed protein product [Rhizophagus irregularis]|nr:unnamed protein product [Rhizophagus irregularis]